MSSKIISSLVAVALVSVASPALAGDLQQRASDTRLSANVVRVGAPVRATDIARARGGRGSKILIPALLAVAAVVAGIVIASRSN